MRVEFLGLPGSGKTSVCNLLDRGGWRIRKENVQEDPWLKQYLLENRKIDLAIELRILTHHYFNLLDYRGLYDSSIFSALAYARAYLSPEDYEDFENLFGSLVRGLSRHVQLVYLKCATQTAIHRVEQRGREFEGVYSFEFIEFLSGSIENLLGSQESRIAEFSTEEGTAAEVAADVERWLRLNRPDEFKSCRQ